MSPRSKREYLEAIFLRYKGASRKEKTTILDEFCAVSAIIVSMLFDCSGSLSGFKSQKHGNEVDLLSMTVRPSLSP